MELKKILELIDAHINARSYVNEQEALRELRMDIIELNSLKDGIQSREAKDGTR